MLIIQSMLVPLGQSLRQCAYYTSCHARARPGAGQRATLGIICIVCMRVRIRMQRIEISHRYRFLTVHFEAVLLPKLLWISVFGVYTMAVFSCTNYLQEAVPSP
jgi:hypothetical protein